VTDKKSKKQALFNKINHKQTLIKNKNYFLEQFSPKIGGKTTLTQQDQRIYWEETINMIGHGKTLQANSGQLPYVLG
jgi:hypothetical protein